MRGIVGQKKVSASTYYCSMVDYVANVIGDILYDK